MTPKPYTKTPFMDELDKKMTEYGLTTSSKMTYLRVLEYISGKPVDDLTFFLDSEAIEKKLEPLKPNTRRVYFTSIHSALQTHISDAYRTRGRNDKTLPPKDDAYRSRTTGKQ
jgi:hypothetical protein